MIVHTFVFDTFDSFKMLPFTKRHFCREFSAKTNIKDKQLWGLDFISNTGKAKQMMSSVRKEHLKLYGKSKVHWRRFSNPTKTHKKEF